MRLDHNRRLRPMAVFIFPALVAFSLNTIASAQVPPFDGGPGNLSTGNLSVGFVQGSPVERVNFPNGAKEWLPALANSLRGLKGIDGTLDGVWTSRRGKQMFAYNSNNKAATVQIDGKTVEIAPHSIYENTSPR